MFFEAAVCLSWPSWTKKLYWNIWRSYFRYDSIENHVGWI